MDLPEHPQHALAKGEEVDVAARQGSGHRIHDELAEPFTHRSRIAEDLLEKRCHGVDIDEGFVHIEHQHGRRHSHCLIIVSAVAALLKHPCVSVGITEIGELA